MRRVAAAKRRRPGPVSAYSLRAAAAARGKPAILGEARDRGAHQPLGQSERRRETDQAAEGDAPAARRDRIAQYGHKERAAAQRLLAPQAPEERAQTGVEWVGHIRLRGRARVTNCDT
jgi:hypothetical protein